MCLELKKPTDPNEDAYFKDFLDILDSDAAVSEKLHSFFNLYLLLLTLMASPAAAFNSTTILVVDAFFTSCLWQLKMLLWWLSCFILFCLSCLMPFSEFVNSSKGIIYITVRASYLEISFT